MDPYELLLRRRSIRNFRDEPVPEDVIEKLLEAAASAPSAGNIQPLSVILVQEKESLRRLAAMNANQPWVANAPLSMIFCIDFHRVKRWANMLGTEFGGERALAHFLVAFADAMCAAQNVVVLAEHYGLGSVYIGTVLSAIDEAREYFEMPEHVVPVMVLTLGYPKSVPSNIPKLKPKAIAHREKYRRPSDEEIRQAFEDKYGSVVTNTEKFLERAFIEAVEADKQADDGWVKRVAAQMEKLGIKNNAEFLFKVRYPPEMMVGMNGLLRKSLENAGLSYFQ